MYSATVNRTTRTAGYHLELTHPLGRITVMPGRYNLRSRANTRPQAMPPAFEPNVMLTTAQDTPATTDAESCATMHDLPDQVFDQIWSVLSNSARIKLFAVSKAARDQVLRCTDRLTVHLALDINGQLHGAQLMHAVASRAGRNLSMALKSNDTQSFKGLAACVQLGADMHLLHGQPWSAVTQLELAVRCGAVHVTGMHEHDAAHA